MTRPRGLVYVESLLGIGHGVRVAAVVQALQLRGFDITCVSGSLEIAENELAGAKLVRLPQIKAENANFTRLIDANGRAIDDTWRRRRSSAILEAYREIQPQIILIEGFPFSRWQFRFELLPLIEAAKGNSTIVCSVRDIIVAKQNPRRINEIVNLIENEFEIVLVHGDEAFVKFDETFPAAKQIENKLRYTGYVTSDAPKTIANADAALGEVLVSVGGGAVGSKLLNVALEVRAQGVLKKHPWRILTGRNLPENEVSALKKQASEYKGLVIEQFRSDFPSLLSSCAVSISQAGYNTIVDLLVARVRAIVVPFSKDSETEQTLRSHLLEKRGLVTVIQETQLSTQLLANTLTNVIASQRPQQSYIALDGATQSASLLYNLAMAVQKNGTP